MNLEFFCVVTPPSFGADWDIRADDVLVVDWENGPKVGEVGAIRSQHGDVQLMLLNAGDDRAGIGRLRRPAELLKA